MERAMVEWIAMRLFFDDRRRGLIDNSWGDLGWDEIDSTDREKYREIARGLLKE